MATTIRQKPITYKGKRVQVSNELLKIQAFMHYIFSGSLKQLQKDLGVNMKVLMTWSEDDHWELKRHAFYSRVQSAAASNLEKLAEQISDTLSKTLAAMNDTLSKLPQSEIGSNSAMWGGIKEATEALKNLLGMVERVQDPEEREMDISDADAQHIIEAIEAEWTEVSGANVTDEPESTPPIPLLPEQPNYAALINGIHTELDEDDETQELLDEWVNLPSPEPDEV